MLKELKVESIMSQDFAEITSDERVSKLVSLFKGSRDVVVVKEDNKYSGVISKKDLIRSTNKPGSTKIKKITRASPKLSKSTDLAEVARLMIENNMANLPVFENEVVVGMVKIDDILKTLEKSSFDVKAKDIMTSKPVTLKQDDSVIKALITCRDHNISRIMITKGDDLIGLISLHDIITPKMLAPTKGLTEHHIIDEKNSAFDMQIKNLMTTDVFTVPDSASVNDLIKEMFSKDISSLVVAEHQKPLGIITKKDILEAVLYESKKSDDEVVIQVASKVNVNRTLVIEEISDFVKKNKKELGPGYINAHITKHKETLRDKHLLHCRLRIRCKQQYDVSSEGYGEEYMMKEAFRKLKSQMLKENRKKLTPEEVYEYTNTSAL